MSVVDIGTPPDGLQGWDIAQVRLHGFADLSTERGEEVDSPEFTCIGQLWRVAVYPGGDEDSADGMIAVYLWNQSDEPIEIEYFFSVRDSTSEEVARSVLERDIFAPFGEEDNNDSRGVDFTHRSTIIAEALVNGTLTVEVRMRKVDQSNTLVAPFIPKNPIYKNILNKFMDEESADVVFEVGTTRWLGGKQAKRGSIDHNSNHRCKA